MSTRHKIIRMRRLPIYRKYQHKPQHNDNLSRAVSELVKLQRDSQNDHDMDGSGELGGQIHRFHCRIAERIAKKHGFTNVEHVWKIASRRITERRPNPALEAVAHFIAE